MDDLVTRKFGEQMKVKRFFLSMLVTMFVVTAAVHADDGLDSISPIMNVPDEVAYQSDFDTARKFDKTEWQQRQGTVWEIVDGVLRGNQSPPEYQAKKADHKGREPRVKSLKTPRQFIAKFSVRFVGGEETKLVPLIEFGHHNVRLKFSKKNVALLADHESVLLAETEEVKFESGRWYHILAERNGDEFVVQFAGGSTLYARHKSLAIPVADDTDGLGIAGTRTGVVEIDNLTLWTIKEKQSPQWPAMRKGIPKMEAQEIPTKKKKIRDKKNSNSK